MEQDSGSLDNQACKFYLAFLTYKSSKNVGIHSEIFLRAIICENRESHDTRQKIEFFFILPKHPF